MRVTIVDIGCGNIASVAFAFERLGAFVEISNDARRIAKSPRVILPGVSAAGYAMAKIDSLGLRETICTLRQPTLGICLGMQLFFEQSEEGRVRCLGIVKGEVRKIDGAPDRPTPHMGWSRLNILQEKSTLAFGLENGAYVYFAHSYACEAGDTTVAMVDYGGAFAALCQSGNFFGCQFHPERSGEVGAAVLSNFLAAPC
ncbi:MAG: imidazole glycerol phosphate synthase subunit HisH [Parvularculaceae bacterium]